MTRRRWLLAMFCIALFVALFAIPVMAHAAPMMNGRPGAGEKHVVGVLGATNQGTAIDAMFPQTGGTILSDPLKTMARTSWPPATMPTRPLFADTHIGAAASTTRRTLAANEYPMQTWKQTATTYSAVLALVMAVGLALIPVGRHSLSHGVYLGDCAAA